MIENPANYHPGSGAPIFVRSAKNVNSNICFVRLIRRLLIWSGLCIVVPISWI